MAPRNNGENGNTPPYRRTLFFVKKKCKTSLYHIFFTVDIDWLGFRWGCFVMSLFVVYGPEINAFVLVRAS